MGYNQALLAAPAGGPHSAIASCMVMSAKMSAGLHFGKEFGLNWKSSSRLSCIRVVEVAAGVVRARAQIESARGVHAVRVGGRELEDRDRRSRRQRHARHGQGPGGRQGENDGGPSLRVGPVRGTSSAHACPF